MKRIGKYQNGNYTVEIYNDGTKIRENNLDFFESSFPENIDIKISNRCDGGCGMCHEKSTINGRNADLLNMKFVDTLRPCTELAIGGGNIFENPQLIPFLQKLKRQNVIANITVNQKHFIEDYSLVKYLIKEKLVYGIGVSFVAPTDNFIDMARACGDNVVIHVINGIVSKEDIDYLSCEGLKILFLGYKSFGFGFKYWEQNREKILENQEYVFYNIDDIFKKFKVVSFDNLAISQIRPERFLTPEQYSEFYMGDEGQFTMYIDAVERKFGQNSIAETRYDLLDDIDDMFKIIKSGSDNK